MSDSPALPALAPSEIILLREEEWLPAGEAWAARRAALGEGVTVSAHEAQVRQMAFLAQMRALTLLLVSAALLAVEQQGTLRLEPATRAAWLGLRRYPSVAVTVSGPPTPWPAHSLEAHFAHLSLRSPREVQALIYDLLPRAAAYPWLLTPVLVQDGLRTRGLLETVRVRPLPLLSAEALHIPHTTAALAAAQSLVPIRDLLRATEQDRPTLWENLQAEIAHGVGRRRTIEAGAPG
jgi:hypothetical protein